MVWMFAVASTRTTWFVANDLLDRCFRDRVSALALLLFNARNGVKPKHLPEPQPPPPSAPNALISKINYFRPVRGVEYRRLPAHHA